MGLLDRATAQKLLGYLADACQIKLAQEGSWGKKGLRVSGDALRNCVQEGWNKIKEKIKSDPTSVFQIKSDPKKIISEVLGVPENLITVTPRPRAPS